MPTPVRVRLTFKQKQELIEKSMQKGFERKKAVEDTDATSNEVKKVPIIAVMNAVSLIRSYGQTNVFSQGQLEALESIQNRVLQDKLSESKTQTRMTDFLS